MRQKILSVGRRPAVFLPRQMVRDLGLREGSAVEVRLDPRSARIEIVPVAEPAASAEARRFMERVDAFIERHRRTLERLAR